MLDFLIFYEIKNREFESIVLLRNELVSRGYTVDYFSFCQSSDINAVRRYRNRVKVAVMPSLYHNTEILEIVEYVAGKVENIVNLRWEQVYTNATEENKGYYAHPKELAQKALHCCWGEKPRQLLESVGIESGNISVTGPMQMDLLASMFDGYYMQKGVLFKEHGIPLDKPCILFISSFSVSTFPKDMREEYILQFEEKERSAYVEFIRKEEQTRGIIADWLIELSRRYGCTVVYRPHPTELDTAEVSRMREEGNVRVIAEGNVKQWIMRCDQVYTWYSTSAAEAYFAKVPCTVLRPVELSHSDDLPIYEGVEYITDQESFFRRFEELASGENGKGGLDGGVMEAYYGCTQERPAYIRTADYLESILSGSYRFPWKDTGMRGKMYSYMKDAKRGFKSVCRDAIEWCEKGELGKVFLSAGCMSALSVRMERHRMWLRDMEGKVISDKEFEDMQRKLASFCAKDHTA